MEKLILMRPTAEYAEQIMECKKEYLAANSSMDGCGPMRRTDDAMEYIEKCALEEIPETCPATLVPATQFMLVRKEGMTTMTTDFCIGCHRNTLYMKQLAYH